MNIYNATFYAGETYGMTLYAVDSTGVALNLAGSAVTFTMKKASAAWSSPSLALTSTPANGITITEAIGRIDIDVTDEDSASLSGEYDYKVEVETSGCEVTREITGKLFVKP